MKLNHLHFPSPRPAETASFYERFFSFKPHVALGPTAVLANEEKFYLAVDPETPASKFHFGFCLDSADAVRSLFESLKASEVSFVSELREISPNAIQFYCLDPAGNRVEVGWYKPLVP